MKTIPNFNIVVGQLNYTVKRQCTYIASTLSHIEAPAKDERFPKKNSIQ